MTIDTETLALAHYLIESEERDIRDIDECRRIEAFMTVIGVAKHATQNAAKMAREVIALLDEVERLREQMSIVRSARDAWQANHAESEKEYEAFRKWADDAIANARNSRDIFQTERNEARQQLAAMSKARDEACEIAVRSRFTPPDVKALIAELRKVGAP